MGENKWDFCGFCGIFWWYQWDSYGVNLSVDFGGIWAMQGLNGRGA